MVAKHGYREAKRCKAYATYELLAANVTFESHIVLLLSPVRSRLPAAGAAAVRNKLTALLQAAGRGVAANPTARPAPLLTWIHSTLEVRSPYPLLCQADSMLLVVANLPSP